MSNLDSRIIDLLGKGITAEQTALALGCSPAYISQKLSDADFSAEVATARYEALRKHNARDDKYDELEDKLLEQLESYLPLLVDPMKIARVLQTINSSKRRGSGTPESITNKQEFVNLMIPTVIVNQYKVNSDNQVIKIGQDDLLTVQSGSLLKSVTDALAAKPPQLTHTEQPNGNSNQAAVSRTTG
jgi:hypothetical protein